MVEGEQARCAVPRRQARRMAASAIPMRGSPSQCVTSRAASGRATGPFRQFNASRPVGREWRRRGHEPGETDVIESRRDIGERPASVKRPAMIEGTSPRALHSLVELARWRWYQRRRGHSRKPAGRRRFSAVSGRMRGTRRWRGGAAATRSLTSLSIYGESIDPPSAAPDGEPIPVDSELHGRYRHTRRVCQHDP